jgi:betaine-aldehyde dehydrogenase
MTEMGRHWIDGAWHESALVADSYNPATGELLGRFADGGEAEARAAVSAARPAFAGTDWGRDRALRSRALLELAERFEARAPELALMLTRENGKTLAEAIGEVGAPAATLRHNAAQTLTEVGTAAEVAPGHYFNSLGRAGRRRRDHRAVERTSGAVHPFPRPRARRREHRRGKAPRADRAH